MVAVGITREPHRMCDYTRVLRHAGVKVINLPVTSQRPLVEGVASLQTRLLKPWDWLVVTSPVAGSIASQFELHGKVAAIGPKSAQSFSHVDFVSGVSTAKSFAHEFAANLSAGAQVLFPQAREGLPDFVTELTALGHQVEVFPVYETIENAKPEEFSTIDKLQVDAILLMAPSQVRVLCNWFDFEFSTMRFFASGPTTEAYATERGLNCRRLDGKNFDEKARNLLQRIGGV